MINSATQTISKTIDSLAFPNHIDWKDAVGNITKLALSTLKLLYYVTVAVLVFPLSFTHPHQYTSITDNVRNTLLEMALRPQTEKQKTHSWPGVIEKIKNHSGKAFIFLGIGVAMLGWLYFYPQTPKLPLGLNPQPEPSSNAFPYWPLLQLLGLTAVMIRCYQRALSHEKLGNNLERTIPLETSKPLVEKDLLNFLISELIKHSEEAQQYIKNTKERFEFEEQKKRLNKMILFAQPENVSKINNNLIPIRRRLNLLNKYFTTDPKKQVISTLEKEIYAILKSPWSFPGLAEILDTVKFKTFHRQYLEAKNEDLKEAYLKQQPKTVRFSNDVIEHDVSKLRDLKATITQHLDKLCGLNESPRN